MQVGTVRKVDACVEIRASLNLVSRRYADDMKRLGLAWLTVVGLSGLAGAQDLRACGGEPGYPAWVRDGVYSGTIGKLAVTLQLKHQDDEQTAYFYHSRGINLALTPFHDGENLILQESHWDREAGRDVATGCFTLRRGGQNLRGDWTTPDAKKKLAVTLSPLNVAAVPLRLPTSPGLLQLRRDAPLTFLKVNRPWLKVRGGLKEPVSGIVYPRLAGSAALNALMQDRQLVYVASALDCTDMTQSNQADRWFDFSAHVDYLTAHLLSVTEGGNGYCGGAHPFLMGRVYTVNRQTAQPFKVVDLWPRLTPARLWQLYVGRFPKDVQECREGASNDPDSLQVLLTSDGLSLYSDGYAEVARACRTVDVTMPYAELKAGANPKSPYYHDIYR